MSTIAEPIARDVIIIGEPVIGGFVRGSYRYDNADENPEGVSRYQWYLDNVKIEAPEGVAIDLRIKSEYSGRAIIFAVTPVAANGETGKETRSVAKTVDPDFQGITREENENSFLKQWGNFSAHVPEPPDRVFVSTGGAFGLIDPDTQDIYFEGQTGWGLPVPPDIINFLKNNPATRLFSTEKDFAALVTNGSSNQLLVWGANISAGHSVKLTDIESVYSNRVCFAFIYKDPTGDQNRIGAIGLKGSGDTIPELIQRALWFDAPVAIHATENAFAVRTQKGKVYAWGNTNNGGAINADAQVQLDNIFVERIIAAAAAFCAIGRNGEIVTWGKAADGGAIPSGKLETIINDGGVNSVTASTTAFCAITRDRRKAVSWGLNGEGGLMSESASLIAARGGVLLCKATRWAFCIITERGEAEAWGAQRYGGASITAATRNEIEAAIKDMQPKPEDAHGHVGSRAITVPGILSLYSNDLSFFLLSQHDDGRTRAVVVWGMNTHGGAISLGVRQALMASRITGVYCTNGAYGVVATQGSVYGAVIVWGATLAMEDAGEIPPELAQYLSDEVVELYSIKRYPFYQAPPPNPPPIDPSFAARRRDGSYVLWGGNVKNQYYKPQPGLRNGTLK
ncbi:hypothetical protein FE275_17200 [Pseudomonas koreensis]|uniref:hypothetical protein n=1 Tax=Pseudomonas koreensis TaxID=198620 RepID=UPI00123BC7E4|nr:hypothetical protein [Pseudomonas koreensis]KAA8738722.1 hypothetical protein FE275_17200 [Pseudomonas koreensis]